MNEDDKATDSNKPSTIGMSSPISDDLKIKLFDSLLCAYRIAETTIKAWGEDAQLNKTVEECAELIVALQHSRSRTLDVRIVASEIADVMVMVMCAARVVGVDIVADEMNKKLTRLKGRLESVKPQIDLEEKYIEALQQNSYMESLYQKEVARSKELQRVLLELQGSLPRVKEEDEKNVDELLMKSRLGLKKRRLTKK